MLGSKYLVSLAVKPACISIRSYNIARKIRSNNFASSAMSLTSDRGGALIKGPAGHDVHLPPAEGPVGPVTIEMLGTVDSYKKAIICPVSATLRTSTHVGCDEKGVVVKGKVGKGEGMISAEDAKVLARGSGLRLLATIHKALDGDLSRVEQVLKLTGFVNGSLDFSGQGAVINGCSEVLIEALGAVRGVGVRVCSGVGSLGGAVSCDVELRVRMN